MSERKIIYEYNGEISDGLYNTVIGNKPLTIEEVQNRLEEIRTNHTAPLIGIQITAISAYTGRYETDEEFEKRRDREEAQKIKKLEKAKKDAEARANKIKKHIAVIEVKELIKAGKISLDDLKSNDSEM